MSDLTLQIHFIFDPSAIFTHASLDWGYFPCAIFGVIADVGCTGTFRSERRGQARPTLSREILRSGSSTWFAVSGGEGPIGHRLSEGGTVIG